MPDMNGQWFGWEQLNAAEAKMADKTEAKQKCEILGVTLDKVRAGLADIDIELSLLADVQELPREFAEMVRDVRRRLAAHVRGNNHVELYGEYVPARK